MESDACPICWRGFGAAAIPVCLNCGHSCCFDCVLAIRQCPLCRHKIAANHPRKPNYSLLAFIEKAEARRSNTASQATQTDLLLPLPPPATTTRARQQQAPFLEGKAMTLAIKKTSIQLQI